MDGLDREIHTTSTTTKKTLKTDKKVGKKDRNPAAELYKDLYGTDKSDRGMTPLQAMLRQFRALNEKGGGEEKDRTKVMKNQGIPPQQYITLRHWNETLDSYQYSLTAATQSKARAAAQYRSKNFNRAFSRGLNPVASTSLQHVTSHQKAKLLEAEKEFLRAGSEQLQLIHSLQTKLTRLTIDLEMEDMGVAAFELDPATRESHDPSNKNDEQKKDKTSSENASDISGATSTDNKKNKQENLEKLSKAQQKLMEAELDFIQKIVSILGTERATGIRVALLGDIAARGSGGLLTQLQERPLTVILEALDRCRKPNVDTNQGDTDIAPVQEGEKQDVISNGNRSLFVTRFSGDVRASQVSKLREEITAIVTSASPGTDEALLILESGGGTVTGYGLAAGQLQRLRQQGIRLTIAVEEVAASGGYMMCCVGDRIVSSPFAALGSIGVITEIPNVYERLQREGVEFKTVTAGKYKRTITPFKETSAEDLEKTKEHLEAILNMFRKFIETNRPQLLDNMDQLATGEVWFGTDALALGLCDDIKTSEDVLLEYVDNGWEVFEVNYRKPTDSKSMRGIFVEHSTDEVEGQNPNDGMLAKGVRWIVRTVLSECKVALSTGSNYETNHFQKMAHYDGADRVRTQSPPNGDAQR